VTVFYIDVSHYDWSRNGGNLDWQAIKSEGIEVVFIRATYGDPLVYNPETRYFVDMALKAKEAGLLVGGYHNLIRGDQSSMERQVAYFREQLNLAGADFAMVDIEPYDALRKLDLWPRIQDAELFAREFSKRDHSRALATYLAKWVWAGFLGKPDLRPLLEITGGPLINANYPENDVDSYKAKYIAVGGDNGPGWESYGSATPEIWQYTSTAIVPGASPVTDVNAFRGTVAALNARLTRKELNVSLIATVLWPGMKALEPTSLLGGIYANKRGYHNKRENLPSTDYSVAQFEVDRQGPNDEAAAIDWTFPNAQGGNYTTISKYSKRLLAARNDADDSRTKYIREYFGQIDSDSTVEGWDFSKNRASTSDKSHLWHIHISIHRKYVNDPTAMKAILSILEGETLDKFKANTGRTVTYQHFRSVLPILKRGDSDPISKSATGTAYVARAQRQLQVVVDGDYGPATALAVKNLGFGNGGTINNDVWERLFAMWGASVYETYTTDGDRLITMERFNGRLPILKYGDNDADNVDGTGTLYVKRAQRGLGIDDDGEYGPKTQAAVKKVSGGDGKTIDVDTWGQIYALWSLQLVGTSTNKVAKK
jgi:hypothetical protein